MFLGRKVVPYSATCPSCGADTTFTSVGVTTADPYDQTRLVEIDVACECEEEAA